jgi:hypothetical protein
MAESKGAFLLLLGARGLLRLSSMKRRTKLLVLACLVVIIGAAVLFLTPSDHMPEYDGKTLSEWLVLLDPDVDRKNDHERAWFAIVQMGPAAVPYLHDILSSRPAPWKEQLQGYAVRWHLMKRPKLSLFEKQYRAARAAYALAESAKVDISALVPELRYHLTNSGWADTEMVRALAGAGPQGVACLTNLLMNGVARVRAQAGHALTIYRATRNLPGIQDAMIRCATSDPDQQTRANAMIYLRSYRVDGDTNKLVALGIQGLQSKDGLTRWAAAMLVGNYLSAPGARAALEGVVDDPDERVGSFARQALGVSRKQTSPSQ